MNDAEWLRQLRLVPLKGERDTAVYDPSTHTMLCVFDTAELMKRILDMDGNKI